MEKHPYALPAAVVIAGGLVGLGLFFGLRAGANGGAASPAARPSAVGPTAAGTAAVLAAPEPPPPPDPGPPAAPARLAAEVQARLDHHVAGELARLKPALARACWEPAVARQPSPPTMKVPIRFLFDGSGKQLYVSVADSQDPRSEEVTGCLRTQGIQISADPMGMNVASAAVLTFP